MSEFEIKVENVVAFTSLGKDISLTKLVEDIEDVEYEPEQFPGLVYRIQDPRAAALIFSSGKIVCTGARSIEMSKEAMHKVVDRIRETGVDLPRQFDIKVENIVASSKIEAKLNLEEIAFSLENAEYEPEQFPGLVYRIREPRVAFLLFSSGKIICTGAHTLSDVQLALRKLKEKLEEIGIRVKTGKEAKPAAEEKPKPTARPKTAPRPKKPVKKAKPKPKPKKKPVKAKPSKKPKPKKKK
jgi:transcription initiation factor TFIID TATA-box-binding protein